jgi:putative spermidine/putrescine transport system permease protein
MLVVFSFKAGKAMTFPFEGFSLKWYSVLFNKPALISAFLRSIELAITVMIVTIVVCITTSLALRNPFPGRDIVFYMVMLGIVTPGIIHGIGAALLYKMVFNLQKLSLWTGLPIHVVWSLPFGILLTLARFDPQLSDYESVARTLGANGWIVFRKITFPLISNQILAAGLFGFTLSFSELMRSLFVIGGPPTLPIYVYSWMGGLSLTPEFYALGTLTIAAVVIILVLIKVLMGRAYGKRLI